MGFFTKKTVCPVCGGLKEIGRLNLCLNDKRNVCRDCLNKLRQEDNTPEKVSSWTADECRAVIRRYEQDIETFPKFQATKKLTVKDYEKFFEFDDRLQLWCINTEIAFGSKPVPRLFRYDEIEDFEYLEDGKTVVTSGGLTRAVGGWLLLGPLGAVVGAVTGERKSTHRVKSMKIVIKLKCREYRELEIVFNKDKELKSNSRAYEDRLSKAKQILASLADMTDAVKKVQHEEAPASPTISIADELLKFKQLLDAGLLTQEEFNQKKQELLNH